MLTLTVDDQKALWAECERQWALQFRRFWWVSLPSQEWEDIKSAAFARVLSRAHRYRPAKGTLDAWVGTVICRVIINSLRRSLPSVPCHDQRTNLQHARPIVQRLVRGYWGDERVEVTPDRACASDPRRLLDVCEFRDLLDRPGQRAVDLLLAGRKVSGVQRRLKITRVAADALVRDLGQRWRAFERGQDGAADEAAASAVEPVVRFPADLEARREAARAVGKPGRRRRRLTCRPSAAFLRKMTPRLNEHEWAHLRKLWPELPTYAERFS